MGERVAIKKWRQQEIKEGKKVELQKGGDESIMQKQRRRKAERDNRKKRKK